MNIDIRVLSSIECCSRISSCKNIEELCNRLTNLYVELSSGSLPASKATLEAFFVHGGHLVVALDKDEVVVGMGTLIFSYKMNEMTARIEDVVVAETHRRQGISVKIMKCLLELALSHQVRYVDLTSHPGRVAANALYDEFGFSMEPTNVRRLVLNT